MLLSHGCLQLFLIHKEMCSCNKHSDVLYTMKCSASLWSELPITRYFTYFVGKMSSWALWNVRHYKIQCFPLVWITNHSTFCLLFRLESTWTPQMTASSDLLDMHGRIYNWVKELVKIGLWIMMLRREMKGCKRLVKCFKKLALLHFKKGYTCILCTP